MESLEWNVATGPFASTERRIFESDDLVQMRLTTIVDCDFRHLSPFGIVESIIST